jgi:hypothetical protein
MSLAGNKDTVEAHTSTIRLLILRVQGMPPWIIAFSEQKYSKSMIEDMDVNLTGANATVR